MNDVMIGQYIPGSSKIHQLDPRTKILLTFWWIITIILTNRLFYFGLTALFLSFILIGAQIPIISIWKSVKPVLPIILFTSFFNLIYTQGTVLWSFYFLAITQEGVQLSLFLILRILLIVIGCSFLTFTTSLTSITDGLESLLAPLQKLGVHVNDVAMMVTIAIRFIPTLSEEIQKIKDAQKSRGASFSDQKFLGKLRGVIPILVPLIYSAFRRAYELTMAIECRCYNHEIKRTKMNQLVFKRNDLVAFSFFCTLFIVVIIGRFN